MLIYVLLLVLLAIATRIIYAIVKILTTKCHNLQRGNAKTAKTTIIIGSGGHTAEMLRLVSKLDYNFFTPRYYIMAATDTSSETKIRHLEERFSTTNEPPTHTDYHIIKIPRSRSVKQSYFSSVFTTLYSFLLSIPIMYSIKPTLILCNGPGTCIPICVISFLMKAFCINNTFIVFVESVCRVKSLSLSGKILLFLADDFFVQWPHLHRLYSRTKYIGRLV